MLVHARNCEKDLHTVHGKSSDYLCASAVGVSADSVFPSTIADWGAVGGESGRIGALHWSPSRHRMDNRESPDREASLIKKEYCRCGPHPPTSDFFQSQTSTCQGSGLHWPPFPGIPGLATLLYGLHCTAGTLNTCTGGCSRRLIAL